MFSDSRLAGDLPSSAPNSVSAKKAHTQKAFLYRSSVFARLSDHLSRVHTKPIGLPLLGMSITAFTRYICVRRNIPAERRDRIQNIRCCVHIRRFAVAPDQQETFPFVFYFPWS